MKYPKIQAVGIDEEKKLFSTNDDLLGVIILFPNNGSEVKILETIGQGVTPCSMPLDGLKKIIAQAKTSFCSHIVLLHKIKLPSGKDFHLDRKDLGLLELIMSVSTKEQFMKKMKAMGKPFP
jgi:hypothetical protein